MCMWGQKQRSNFSPALGVMLLIFACGLAGCQSAYLESVGGDPNQTHTRIFPSQYPMVWSAVLEVFKTTPLETVNRESGVIETQWVDNTIEKNLLESAGTPTPYVKARYKFKIRLSEGYYEGRPSVRVHLTKTQQVLRDVLEGFRSIDTDGIQERTIMYRLGQVIAIQKKLSKLEEERIKRQLEEAKKSMPDTNGEADPLKIDPELD